jgi:hypothetical protein
MGSPSSYPAASPDPRDWEATNSTPLTRNAALSVLSLGVFCEALALQLVVKVVGQLDVRSACMVLMGLVCFFFGRRFQHLLVPRRALEGAVVGGVVLVLGFAWFLWLMFTGMFSALALALVPHAALTMALCVLSVEPARKAEAARVRLRRLGFEV